MNLSVYIVPLRYTFSSLSTISWCNFELSPSIMILTSCFVSPLEGTFYKASTIFASVVFTSENPSLVSSACDGAFIPSRLLGSGVNSMYLPRSLVFFLRFFCILLHIGTVRCSSPHVYHLKF